MNHDEESDEVKELIIDTIIIVSIGTEVDQPPDNQLTQQNHSTTGLGHLD